MELKDSIQKAIDYIEKNIADDLDTHKIATHVCMSYSHFQRIFLATCGVTVGEYIRKRKLALAGKDVITTNAKVIDIAGRYGYESPEGFSRAFSRFHNASPRLARNLGEVKSFAKISVVLKNREECTMEKNCSFCGKSHTDVKVLVEGPGGVCICDECVGICSKVIVDNVDC